MNHIPAYFAMSLWPNQRRVYSAAQLVALTRQLATMLNAGIPLLQSLTVLANGSTSPRQRQLLQRLSSDIGAGKPLSTALGQHPHDFSAFYCNLVASAEQSGTLDSIFLQLASALEKKRHLTTKVRKALAYPLAILAISLAVTGLLLVYVVPGFVSLYTQSGTPLPALTQGVVSCSSLLRNHGIIIGLGLTSLCSMFLLCWRHYPPLKNYIQSKTLYFPLIGQLLRKVALARLTRTLATSLSAGVPLIDALHTTAKTVGHPVYQHAIRQINQRVREGIAVHQALPSAWLFPSLMQQMIAVGEQSGMLAEMLDKLAIVYEQQVDEWVAHLTTLLEPAIMMLLGGIVGILVLAMYLPIFDLGSVIR